MAGSANTNSKSQTVLSQELLALVAEDLKASLVQIARISELAELKSTGSAAITDIQMISQAALKLVDNYALGLKLANFEPGVLALEPVAVSGVLATVTEELRPLATSYGVTLELDLTGRQPPVIANARVLGAALASAGAGLIEAIAAEQGQAALKLCLRRGTSGAEAGWYWSEPKISAEIIKRGRTLTNTRQPLASFTSSPTSGIFIADLLLQIMGSRLKTSKFNSLNGLAVRLRTSSQLELV